MLTDILHYLTEEKVLILGAAATLCELVVIIINTYRQIHNQKKIETMSLVVQPTRKTFLWACNPINLFRKP